MRNCLPVLLLLLLLNICLIASCSNGTENTTYINYHRPLLALIDSLHLDKNKVEIHIDKSDYCLSVVIDKKVIKSYPVVLGFNPVADKMKEGDGCTPEGTFTLIDLYPHQSWSKFLWIGYPNEDSHRKFKDNKAAGKISAIDKIGGEIGIHGVPAGRDEIIDAKRNWTHGCISLKNADVDEVYSAVKVGTRVVIRQ